MTTMRRFLSPMLTALVSVIIFLTYSGDIAAQKLYLIQEEVADSKTLLPPPPQPGSPEFLADEYHFFQAKLLRDTPRGEQAVQDADMSDKALLKFAESFGLEITKETMPQTYELLMRSKECFGGIGCKEAKEYYRRTRPFVYYGESSMTPESDEWMKTNYSYPSGHSANYYGLAYILCALRPERQNEILKRADEGAYSRVIAGCHWMSDIKAARIIAGAVFARLQANDEYLAQFRKARKEVRRMCGK